MSIPCGALHRAVLVLVALLLLAVATAAPAVAAKPTKCLVVDQTSDSSYKSLQAAVDASPAGASLRVKGTCVGPTTISRDITIVGQSVPGFGQATLDGDHRGSVLTIQSHSTVTLRGLVVTNGTAPAGGGVYVHRPRSSPIEEPSSVTLIDTAVAGNSATGERGGGGVGIDAGTLTLVDSTVRDNTATANGGGIFVGLDHDGILLVHGTSSVRGNHAGSSGGGVFVEIHGSRATLYDSSSIDHNSADHWAGGMECDVCAGITLNDDSSIHHNTAGVAGGGLESGGPSRVHMRDRSSIHDNTAPEGGGAWLNVNTLLDMSGTSSIHHNTATGNGGGAFLVEGATLAIDAEAYVSENVPDNCYPPGVVVGCTP